MATSRAVAQKALEDAVVASYRAAGADQPIDAVRWPEAAGWQVGLVPKIPGSFGTAVQLHVRPVRPGGRKCYFRDFAWLYDEVMEAPAAQPAVGTGAAEAAGSNGAAGGTEAPAAEPAGEDTEAAGT